MSILKILKTKKPAKEKSKASSLKAELKPASKQESTNEVSLSRYLVKRPWISEKATYLSPMNQYIFAVQDSANKNSIKHEIEKRFNVKVERVNIIIKKPKTVHWGARSGKRGGVKKAIVTLKQGHKIDVI